MPELAEVAPAVQVHGVWSRVDMDSYITLLLMKIGSLSKIAVLSILCSIWTTIPFH